MANIINLDLPPLIQEDSRVNSSQLQAHRSPERLTTVYQQSVANRADHVHVEGFVGNIIEQLNQVPAVDTSRATESFFYSIMHELINQN